MVNWYKDSMFNQDFDRFFVGHDKYMKQLADAANTALKTANYPPYNVKKIDDNKYVIEMAVAGFAKQDLEIEIADNKLIIRGNIQSGEEAAQDSKGEWTWPQVLYQGLAMRPFTRTFNLADNVEIQGAEMFNGILKVVLESIVPEHKKPKKIDIAETEKPQKAKKSS